MQPCRLSVRVYSEVSLIEFNGNCSLVTFSWEAVSFAAKKEAKTKQASHKTPCWFFFCRIYSPEVVMTVPVIQSTETHLQNCMHLHSFGDAAGAGQVSLTILVL